VATDTPANLRTTLLGSGRQSIVVEFGGAVDEIVERIRELEAVCEVELVERSGEGGTSAVTCKVRCSGGQDRRNEIARCILDAGGRLLSLREEQLSLEQVFIRLTQGEQDEADVAHM